MQQQLDYHSLLREFTAYKQKTVAEKDHLRREVEKCRQQLDKFTSKLDKRVDMRLQEERKMAQLRMEEMEVNHIRELEQMRQHLAAKDQVIDEMKHLMRALEAQKRELVQHNTKVLVELSQGQRGELPVHPLDQNYKQLLKMYQFLIEENNQLKKEIYLMKRNQLTISNRNDSFLTKNESMMIKQEKSLNNSQYKPKSLTENNSKVEAIAGSKSPKQRELPSKVKAKRPPSHKPAKK